MPRKRTTKIGKLEPPLDVRAENDIKDFEKILSSGPLTIVLIYADWCGHCTRFKDSMWNQMAAMPNKNINTASVHYDMLDKTSLADSKIEGYPSLLMVGTDKKPANFKEPSGVVTNAMPQPTTPEELKTMLQTPIPETVKNANSVAENVIKNISKNNGITVAEEAVTINTATKANNKAAEEALTNIVAKANNKAAEAALTNMVAKANNKAAVTVTNQKKATPVNSAAQAMVTAALATPAGETPVAESVYSVTEEIPISPTMNVVNMNKKNKNKLITAPTTANKNAYTPTTVDQLVSPPDPLTNLVESQKSEAMAQQKGGSLMESLLRITGEAAHVGLLMSAATLLSEKKRRHNKTASRRNNKATRKTLKKRR